MSACGSETRVCRSTRPASLPHRGRRMSIGHIAVGNVLAVGIVRRKESLSERPVLPTASAVYSDRPRPPSGRSRRQAGPIARLARRPRTSRRSYAALGHVLEILWLCWNWPLVEIPAGPRLGVVCECGPSDRWQMRLPGLQLLGHALVIVGKPSKPLGRVRKRIGHRAQRLGALPKILCFAGRSHERRSNPKRDMKS